MMFETLLLQDAEPKTSESVEKPNHEESIAVAAEEECKASD